MRGRKIPYGYKMSNGRYVLEKKEAEIVKLVYEMTAAGKLPNETLKIVQNMDTEYFADDVDKRESKLSCLLRKEYYCGSGDYPAIISLNSVYTGDSNFMSIIEDNIGCVLSEEDELGQAITKMENRIREIEKMRDNLINLVTTGAVDIESSDDKFKALNSEEKYLRDQIEQLKLKAQTKTDLRLMLKTISDELKNYDDSIIKYNETAVRKVVECVKVVSKTEIEITFKGGFDMTVEVEK